MKVCSKCKTSKELVKFYKNKKSPDGYRYWCIECTNVSNNNSYDKYKERRTKSINIWRNANPELVRQYQKDFHKRNRADERIKKYGLTKDEYQALLDKFDNKCHVCGKYLDGLSKATSPHIDHDHSCCSQNRKHKKSCGKCVRGILCEACNYLLGHSYNSIETLKKAITYLEEYNATSR